MYSELLSALCSGTKPPDQEPSQGQLVVVLLRCRHRLRRRVIDNRHMTADDLALELDHDRHLLWLCAAMGIDDDPAKFVNRASERQVLEEALRRRGVDLDELETEYERRAEAFRNHRDPGEG